MTAHLINVQLLLDVESDAEAYDAVNEILRDQQRVFTPESCLIDYALGEAIEKEIDLDNYEEGDAFT